MLQIDFHSVDEILGNPVALLKTEVKHTSERLSQVNFNDLLPEEIEQLLRALVDVRIALNHIVRNNQYWNAETASWENPPFSDDISLPYNSTPTLSDFAGDVTEN